MARLDERVPATFEKVQPESPVGTKQVYFIV
jgi:hypothetical protein